jgi:two-component system, LuxR family, sensor kinase FixL
MDAFAIYSQENRTGLVALGLVLIFAIAVIDLITPNLPLGYLYLLPILLMSGFLDRGRIAVVVIICAVLTAIFSRFDLKQAIILFVMAWTGFTGTAYFVTEVIQNRQKALDHIREIETEIRLRQETEGQLQGLVESSPLAIITIDTTGNIRLANDAAQSLFAPGGPTIAGQPISQFLPALQTAMQQSHTQLFRTQIRCRGKRNNGDVFLAAVWFSTSVTAVGPIVSAIIVDFSEDLRDREDLSLEHLLKNAKILVGALAHEIRNLCGAVSIVYNNLSRFEGLEGNEDFRALGGLIQGLEKLATMELKPSWHEALAAVELSSVLDEFRIVIEQNYSESGMTISWQVQEGLPLVVGDRYGLLQVFLNLARNSQRAMQGREQRELSISSAVESHSVVIRFKDTGVGISDPSGLFQPFYQNADATGLGLYISRAILRSFRGDVRYEAPESGCCFAIRLAKFVNSGDSEE